MGGGWTRGRIAGQSGMGSGKWDAQAGFDAASHLSSSIGVTGQQGMETLGAPFPSAR